MAEIIQSLWIGESLGPLQKLSIASFLNHGHEYHLHCYQKIGNLPSGVVVKDASETLPASAIFYYQNGPGRGSVAAFANLFRYKLLLEKGGWWVQRRCRLPESIRLCGADRLGKRGGSGFVQSHQRADETSAGPSRRPSLLRGGGPGGPAQTDVGHDRAQAAHARGSTNPRPRRSQTTGRLLPDPLLAMGIALGRRPGRMQRADHTGHLCGSFVARDVAQKGHPSTTVRSSHVVPRPPSAHLSKERHCQRCATVCSGNATQGIAAAPCVENRPPLSPARSLGGAIAAAVRASPRGQAQGSESSP